MNCEGLQRYVFQGDIKIVRRVEVSVCLDGMSVDAVCDDDAVDELERQLDGELKGTPRYKVFDVPPDVLMSRLGAPRLPGLNVAEQQVAAPAEFSVIRCVTIPSCLQHEGIRSVQVRLFWTCPVCGGPRGEPYDTISFDGSRRLAVQGWRNPCGHIDHYYECRKEAIANGLNTAVDKE